MDEKVLQEPLLSDQEDADFERDDSNIAILNRELRKLTFARYVAGVSLFLMIISWVEIAILLRKINEVGRTGNRSIFSKKLPPEFIFPSDFNPGGLKYDTPVEYSIKTVWGDVNETISDQAWDTVDSSPIVVALSDEYASQHGLEKSTRFPWDDTKGIYHVKAFHHLHCLVLLPLSYQ